MTKTLYLYLGHGKTGTSLIQDVFITNQKELGRLGIFYPTGAHAKVVDGDLSSGNIGRRFNNPGGIQRAVAMAKSDLPNSLLASELAFNNLARTNSFEKLVSEANAVGFSKVKALIFTREPETHMPSFYSQAVKRRAYTGSILEFIDEFYDTPARVFKFIEGCRKAGIELELHRYEDERDNLISCVSAWLGIPVLPQPTRKENINRSLTRGEIHFLRALNVSTQRSFPMLDTYLTENGGQVVKDPLRLLAAERTVLFNKCQDDMERVNALFEDRDIYFSHKETPPDDEYSGILEFHEDQIETLAEAVGKHIYQTRPITFVAKMKEKAKEIWRRS